MAPLSQLQPAYGTLLGVPSRAAQRKLSYIAVPQKCAKFTPQNRGAWSRGMIFASHYLVEGFYACERSWVQFPQRPFFCFCVLRGMSGMWGAKLVTEAAPSHTNRTHRKQQHFCFAGIHFADLNRCPDLVGAENVLGVFTRGLWIPGVSLARQRAPRPRSATAESE